MYVQESSGNQESHCSVKVHQLQMVSFYSTLYFVYEHWSMSCCFLFAKLESDPAFDLSWKLGKIGPSVCELMNIVRLRTAK